MLFLLPFMSNLPSRKGVENKHNYDGGVCVWGGGGRLCLDQLSNSQN